MADNKSPDNPGEKFTQAGKALQGCGCLLGLLALALALLFSLGH